MKKQLLLLVVMLAPMLASADVVEIDGIYYNLVSKAKEAHITQHPNNQYAGEIAIPNTVNYEGDTYNVTSIEDKAFQICFGLTSITIPESVKSIGESAFSGCTNLVSVTLPNSVTSIKTQTFWLCGKMTSINIPESVTYIGVSAFAECFALSSIDIPNSVTSIDKLAFYRCYSLTEVTIPNSVTSLGNMAFMECSNLISVNIPNSLITISQETFSQCTSLSTVIVPNNINTIGPKAFYNCKALTTVTIGSGTNNIQSESFASCSELKDVYCLAENVPYTSSNAFKDSYIEYATLHVPTKSVNSYKQRAPWNNFKEIVNLDGTIPETPKCEKPTISYENGQLIFTSTTEGVEFVSDITDTDIRKHYNAIIALTATYNISVYATKEGYDKSDVATATLCWIDSNPKTEGITDDINQIPSKALLIKNNGGQLTIEGADDGEVIEIYTLNGMHYGSAVSQKGIAHIDTNFHYDNVAVVKIGNKSIKVVIK